MGGATAGFYSGKKHADAFKTYEAGYTKVVMDFIDKV